MDLPVRKKLPHTVPQWVTEGSWFFITIKCVPPGKNQLCQMADGQVGRVTPCAPPVEQAFPLGGQRTARPTIGEGVLAAMAHNHQKLVWHCRLWPCSCPIICTPSWPFRASRE